MGEITFEGKPPFDPLFVRSPKVRATEDGVEVTLILDLQGLQGGASNEAVSIRLLLEPTDAELLCPNLSTQAGVVRRWKQRGYDGA